LTWNPVGNIQVRGAFSQTITRPQFRELAAADFVDPDLGITLTGNPFLQNSEIDNFDIRAEWYFDRGEFLTVGLFYKDITNPIEQFQTGREANSTSFLNAPSAEVYGVEFEFEKNFALDEIFDAEFWDARELFFATNYTYSKSEVSSDGTVIIASPPGATGIQPREFDGANVINDGRALQGQSDHLFNLQLGIENQDTGTRVTGLLNYASERVVLPAANATDPAVFEQPPISLDLVVNQTVEVGGKEFGLDLKVQNLLGEDYNAYREDQSGAEAPFLQYDRGTTFSIGLDYDF
ncbi:MAG: TonB-dependent receptor, partial [Pseudomonadota bacterium]